MKDIETIELLKKVAEIGAIYEYNSNSYDATKCPFCLEWEYGCGGSMNTIEHSTDCGWLLSIKILNDIRRNNS